MFKKKFIGVLILGVLLSSCTLNKQNKDDVLDSKQNEVQVENEVNYRSIFNGAPLETQQSEYKAFGIIISNSREARPQSGIGLADIVYEVSVESYSITRFLAIFASNHPNKVGPARSARIPFVRIIQEWGLPFAHYGAAKKGLGDAKTLIEKIKPPIRFDGVHGINSKYYFRTSERKAPHNAYFNSEAALDKIPELKYEEHFNFDESSNIKQNPVKTLNIYYSSYTPVKYEYDSQQNKYLRFIHNEPMMDTYNQKQVAVTNIIVMHAPHSTVEKARYVLVDLIGEGKAEYYINGFYEEGIWEKTAFDSVTHFLNAEGEAITLLPGNTWIQIVHSKVDITRE